MKQEIKENAWKYVCMLGANYLNIIAVMWVLVDTMKCSPYLSLIISTCIGAVVNFLLMKYFVFAEKPLRSVVG
jgi:putative flippase GtrA